MNVDIHPFGIDVYKDNIEGVLAERNVVPESGGNGVADGAVVDIAPVEKKVLIVPGFAQRIKIAHESGYLHQGAVILNGYEIFRCPAAEHFADALLQPGRLEIKDVMTFVDHGKGDLRIGEGEPVHHGENITVLGALYAQKLASRRRVKKQVFNGDGGAGVAAGFLDLTDRTTLYGQLRAFHVTLQYGLHFHPCDRGDAGQRFAAKAQGGNTFHILVRMDFRSRMPLQREYGILFAHAATVVHHLDQLTAAALDDNGHMAPAGVDGVFHQLFDHRRRPVDHLAGGDLVNQVFRQNMNFTIVQFHSG